MNRPLLALLAALLALPCVQADNLYSEQTFRALAADKRARLPGDVLTVLIAESSSAVTSADAALQKHDSVGVDVAADRHKHDAKAGVNNSFSGGGTIQRAGKLLAQMSVQVTGVAPNGDLLVAGEQSVEINADRQKIRVEGRVRPIDIQDNNTVFSFRLAEAKVSYLGDGALADRQRPGLLSRFFIWAGL